MLIFGIIFIISIFGLLLLFSITSSVLGMSVILNLRPYAVILATLLICGCLVGFLSNHSTLICIHMSSFEAFSFATMMTLALILTHIPSFIGFLKLFLSVFQIVSAYRQHYSSVILFWLIELQKPESSPLYLSDLSRLHLKI